jgi:hypothetical protein
MLKQDNVASPDNFWVFGKNIWEFSPAALCNNPFSAGREVVVVFNYCDAKVIS